MSKLARLSPAQIALRSATLAVLAVFAALSLFQAIQGALSSSGDLPWRAASLLRSGIDPWQAARSGSIPAPPHLHALYIVFRPLTLLTMQHAAIAWCCLNLAFSVGAIALLTRLFRLSRFAGVSLLLLLWISAPFRTALQAGGIDVLELFLLCVAFSAGNSTVRGVALGFSFCSYLYAPVATSFFWFRGHLRTVAIACTVPVLALIMTCGLLGESVGELILAPLPGLHLTVGRLDLLSTLQTAASAFLPAFAFPASVLVLAGCLMSGASGLFISRLEMSRGAQFALVGASSLLAMPLHASMLLVAPLGYALSHKGTKVRLTTLPIVGALWMADGVFDFTAGFGLPGGRMAAVAGSCLLLALAAHLTWALPQIEGPLHPQEEPASVAGSPVELTIRPA